MVKKSLNGLPRRGATLVTCWQVITALGGKREVAALVDRSQNQIDTWCRRGWFSPFYYIPMSDALARKGYKASAALWRMSDLKRRGGRDAPGGAASQKATTAT